MMSMVTCGKTVYFLLEFLGHEKMKISSVLLVRVCKAIDKLLPETGYTLVH